MILAGCLALTGIAGDSGVAAPFPSTAGPDLNRACNRLPAVAVAIKRHGHVKRHSHKRRKARAASEEATQPQLPPNVTLKAAMAPGGGILTTGVSWRVFEAGESPQEKKLVWSGGAEAKIHLEPGSYLVEADYGLAQNAASIEVPEEKPLETTLVLNAGTIHVRGVAVPGGLALQDMFFVLRSSAGAPDAHDLARSTLADAAFHAPAGSYRLFAQHGFAFTETAVNVEAGKEVNAEVVMNTGVLALSARATQDGPPLSGATFFVYEDSDAPDRREIARSVRDEPSFDLPAGTYRVAAALGLAREERKVVIAAGNERPENFTLNAGGVRLSSMLSGNRQPLDRSLLYKVFALSPANGSASQALVTTASTAPTIFLRQGKYRIESQYGWHNARQVREVDISAGETADVSFEHTACDVTLKLVSKAGAAPLVHVKWTLKYSGGGTVLISQDATPTLILQAGDYQAMAQHETKTFSRTFEAVANSEQTIELIAE